jgi:excinuclease UvrABC ATPase subunit
MSKAVSLREFLDMMDDDPYRYLRLQPGEVVCDKCSGTGDDLQNEHPSFNYYPACTKCSGSGKVSWLQDIFER